MRALLAAVAATATAGILAGAVDGAPARVDQIAFTNNKAIYVIGADGTGLRRVTHSPYSDGGVGWSHDGRLLAFTRYFKQTGCAEDQGRGDLFLIGSNGAGERRLTHSGCLFASPRSATFAAKGQTLAFDDDHGILVTQAPGWKPRVVAAQGFFPSWAPDAHRLVYEDAPSIQIVDTGTRRISRIGKGSAPAWSHDGGRIACVASGNQLWTTDAAGKHPVRLLTKTRIFGPVWSPDDRLIAFYTENPLNQATTWVVPAAGGKAVKLGSGAFPAWAPGGDMLSIDGPGDSIYLVRSDGTGRHRLTRGFNAAWDPAP